MNRNGPVGLVTLVCLTCGKEHFFDREVPHSVKCPQCSGIVFRQFATPTEPDEAALAQLEEQSRSMAFDDVSPEMSQGDARDLDAR